jgi:hypothetical protein
MKMMRNLGRAIRRGAVAAASKNMAPAMGGAVTTTSTRMQPAIGAAAAASKAVQARGLNESKLARSAALAEKMEKMGRMTTVSQPMSTQTRTRMPPKAPLSNLRSSVKSMAANVKTAVAKQPALQKAVASQANKPVGRLVGGLSSKFLKRR